MKFEYILEKQGTKGIVFVVKEQDKSLYSFNTFIHANGIHITSSASPQLTDETIYIRGTWSSRNMEPSIRVYDNITERDKMYNLYKEALEEFSLKVNGHITVQKFEDTYWVEEK